MMLKSKNGNVFALDREILKRADRAFEDVMGLAPPVPDSGRPRWQRFVVGLVIVMCALCVELDRLGHGTAAWSACFFALVLIFTVERAEAVRRTQERADLACRAAVARAATYAFEKELLVIGAELDARVSADRERRNLN